MVVSRLALLVAVVAITVFLLPASGPASSAPMRVVPAAPTSPAPRLGIVSSKRGQGVWRTSLVRIDPRTLRARPGQRLALRGFDAWSLSHDGSRLAFADDTDTGIGGPPRVLAVDTSRLRTSGGVRLASSGWVRATAWLPNGRFVAVLQIYVPFRTEVVTVDATGHKVLERQTFSGEVLRITRSQSRLVALLAPAQYDQSLGPARLLIVEPTGVARIIVVSEIAAGSQPPSDNRGPVEERQPGLAVDFAGRRAFVAAADGNVAEVALGTGAVSYHRLSHRVSFLGRLHAWLEPAAEAKLPREGSTRITRWLGSGMIAVSGGDYAAVEGSRHVLSRFTPAGLSVIDTRSWSVHTLGEGMDAFWHAGSLLLGAATTSSGYETEVPSRPPGLVAFGRDGRERFRLYPGKHVWVVYANARRAFVSTQGSIDVIDLRSGRIVERRAQTSFAYPLVPPGPAVENQ